MGSVYRTNTDFTGKIRWDRCVDAPRGSFIDELLRTRSDYATASELTKTGNDSARYIPKYSHVQGNKMIFPAMPIPIFGQYSVHDRRGDNDGRTNVFDATPNIPKTTIFLPQDPADAKFTEYFLIMPKQRADQESAMSSEPAHTAGKKGIEHSALREEEVKLEQLIANAKVSMSSSRRARGE